MKRIGLALGGGGAKGFAHIAYLEALDELGVRPCAISGTSMGSVMGAMYVCGYTPRMILDVLKKLSETRLSSPGILSKLQYVPPIIAASGVKRLLCRYLGEKTFEDAPIPLKTIAVNFHTLEEVVFSCGRILDGVMASIALPGFFPPYLHEGVYYIDGGATNIVPFNVLRDECDILIAIDVSLQRSNPDLTPTTQNAAFATWNAASALILNYQFEKAQIELLERPEFPEIGATQFDKYIQVYEKARARTDAFKERLSRLL
jgi:NTE family protein